MNRLLLIGLLGIALFACQQSPYLLVEIDGVPQEGRSLRVSALAGGKLTPVLPPIVLPNAAYAGLTVRLDLPPETQGEVEVAISAYTERDATGCLVATGIGRGIPSGALGVKLSPLVLSDTPCVAGEPVVLEVLPAMISTSLAPQSELVLSGWGFRPDSQIAIDGVPVSQLTFVSATTVKVVPGLPARIGLVPIHAQQPGSVEFVYNNLLRYYSMNLNFSADTYSVLAVPNVDGLIYETAVIRDFQGRRVLSAIMPSTASAQPVNKAFSTHFTVNSGGGQIVPEDQLFVGLDVGVNAALRPDHLDIDLIEDLAARTYVGGVSMSPQTIAVRDISGTNKYKCTAIDTSNLAIPSFAFSNFDIWSPTDFAKKYLVISYENNPVANIGILHGDRFGRFNFGGSPGICQRASFTLADGTSHNPTNISKVLAIDVDGDRRSELLLVEAGGRTLTIAPLPAGNGYLQDPQLPFSRVHVSSYGPDRLANIATSDLDGDGKSDLILLVQRTGTAELIVRLSRSSGQQVLFADSSVSLAADCIGTPPIRVADVNEDTFSDILVGCQRSNMHSIEVLASQGQAGVFASQMQSISLQGLNTGAAALSIEAMQVVEDGPLELVAAGGASALVLRNTSR